MSLLDCDVENDNNIIEFCIKQYIQNILSKDRYHYIKVRNCLIPCCRLKDYNIKIVFNYDRLDCDHWIYVEQEEYDFNDNFFDCKLIVTNESPKSSNIRAYLIDYDNYSRPRTYITIKKLIHYVQKII